jgi:enoyl-CoA hydratase/carnithine racemase
VTRALTYTLRDQVARVTLHRPDDGNRLTPQMAAELREACEEAEDSDAVAVILDGAGAFFCAGLAQDVTPEDVLGGLDPVGAVARVTKPVIAVLGGPASGPGAELALAADFRIVSPATTFTFPEVAHGRIPTFGATQRLPRLIGRTRAIEILLLGRDVSGAEAVEIGLATRMVPVPEMAAAVEALVQTLSRHGRLALALAKEAVLRAGDLALADGMRLEEDLYVLLQTTEDRREGVRSFLDKRPPRYRGR